MIKLGNIEFDNCIFDALRDDKLVVFAGAGVSMAPPSNLVSFKDLTSKIAQGTGAEPTEPLDRFLGQLQHRKVDVHNRAAEILSPAGSAPNDLHQNLLRIFRTAERVRLVTTNFDLHFETAAANLAATNLFGSTPEVYRAPALPRGDDFTGIVHVHGTLSRPRDMVLTDADFGRAYLTEGWGRRFLVNVFRQFNVLFVGYSHNDVIMNYLARALPADGTARRFALTDEAEIWNLLGIKPILFTKKVSDAGSYQDLHDGVQHLAELVERGVLGWRNRMAEIGSRIPPADSEAISEVAYALRAAHTTRFLINVARNAEWPGWLNERKHLDALFGTGKLSERDELLAEWLAEHFAIAHADTMFELVAAHGLQMNPQFWWFIGCALGDENKPIQASDLKRWVTILLTSAPNQNNTPVLMRLAERSASHNSVPLTLKVFLKMSEYRLSVERRFRWYDEKNSTRVRPLDIDFPLRADHHSLNEVWIKHIKPNLASVAQPLLSGVTHRLAEIHGEFVAWDKASPEQDPVSYGRSAIERHEQNGYPEAVDVLIDAARDALECLATSAPASLEAWVENLVTSNVPMLRRLAIHAITVQPDKSADDRLKWLLVHDVFHGFLEHHEVYQAVACSYAGAGDAMRRAVVAAVLAHQLPASLDRTAEMRTARLHFDWLSWLLRAKTDCAVAGAALATIKASYPDWQPAKHPDFTHWRGSVSWGESQSPQSIEQLVARTPRDQINDLLNFEGQQSDGTDRSGLISSVSQACKKKTDWAFELVAGLVEKSQWNSDLWPAAIRGLQESELSLDGWRDLLAISAKPELLEVHSHEVANLLFTLFSNGGKPFAADLLEQANAIAWPLWRDLHPDLQDEDIKDWLSLAINRPAGWIVEFWINGLSLLMSSKKGPERVLPENYRLWFTTVVQDATLKGGIGRSLLASQTAFLFGLDEPWTRQHLIPLFDDTDGYKFAQAWDGFLAHGQLYPTLVEALMPAVLTALQRLSADQSGADRWRLFIDFYTGLAVFHVSDPRQQLLPKFFQHGSIEDRNKFAAHLGYFLNHMQPDTKKQMWNRWLHRYWCDRLQGVLAPLEDEEIREMLEWLLHLDEIFPFASLLAIQAKAVAIGHSNLLFGLLNSNLVTRYPAETAALLIYLCKCGIQHHATDLRTVATRLPELAPDLRHRLDEALVVRLG